MSVNEDCMIVSATSLAIFLPPTLKESGSCTSPTFAPSKISSPPVKGTGIVFGGTRLLKLNIPPEIASKAGYARSRNGLSDTIIGGVNLCSGLNVVPFPNFAPLSD